MTRVERNKKIKALEIKRRKYAKEMMKIYRRRRRVLRLILNVIKCLALVALPLNFIMYGVTVDPVYTGNLHYTWFIVAMVAIVPIFKIADDFSLKLKNYTKR